MKIYQRMKNKHSVEENLKSDRVTQHVSYRNLLENDFHVEAELYALPTAKNGELLFTQFNILGQRIDFR